MGGDSNVFDANMRLLPSGHVSGSPLVHDGVSSSESKAEPSASEEWERPALCENSWTHNRPSICALPPSTSAATMAERRVEPNAEFGIPGEYPWKSPFIRFCVKTRCTAPSSTALVASSDAASTASI